MVPGREEVVHVDGSQSTLEWGFLEAENKQQHSKGKDVHLIRYRVVCVEIDLLGGTVHWSGVLIDIVLDFITQGRHLLGLPDLLRCATEIAQLEHTSLGQQHILHLYISMNVSCLFALER